VKKIKTGNRKYSDVLKRKIAEEYLSGQYSYSVGAERYQLKNGGVVKEFVRWYKSQCGGFMEEKDEEKVSGSESSRIEELEAELARARMKISSLEVLIERAEEELSIQIRKKSGTKASK